MREEDKHYILFCFLIFGINLDMVSVYGMVQCYEFMTFYILHKKKKKKTFYFTGISNTFIDTY